MYWELFEPKFEYEDIVPGGVHGWTGHTRFAYDFVRNIKPQVIVELGVHIGISFFSFCQAVKDIDMGTELHAIDTWGGDKHTGFYGDKVFTRFMTVKDAHYPTLK